MNPHPSQLDLERFASGLLENEQAGPIEDHLRTCQTCVQLLDSIDTHDHFIDLVRNAKTAPLPPDSSPKPVPITEIPHGYELIEPIGRGGMGVVFKARQLGMDRIVALKQMRAGLDASPEERRRFRNEVEAVARLRHPNIVQVFDVGEREGSPYFAMEYLEGGTLADLLANGPLKPAAAAALTQLLAEASQAAHAAGIVHRDLKPANILLGPRQEPKIADFGLAKQLDRECVQTNTGALLGTPSYMSPEQAQGSPTTPATDIYALGVLLFECLTGRPPFQAATPLETLEQLRTCDPPAPSRLQPGVPRDLQTICLKCLEKDPKRRYRSAAALAADCQRYLNNQPIEARPVGALERAWKWAKRSPQAAALLLLGTLSIAGLFAGLIAHQNRLAVEVHKTEAAATRAREEAARADANYREARATIERMLAHFNAADLAQSPGLLALRRRESDEALKFFQGVLKSLNGNDPNVRLDTARALTEVATLQAAMGDTKSGLATIDRAIQMAENLTRSQPKDPQSLHALVTAYEKKVYLLGGSPDAELVARNALAIAQRLEALEPNRFQNIHSLAWCHHNLASALIPLNKIEDALPHAEAAVRAYERARILEADNPAIGLELSESDSNLGLIQAMLRQPDSAKASYARAHALVNAYLEHDPTSQHAIITRGDIAVNWGNLLAAEGQHDAAAALFNPAIDDIHRILELEPQLSRARTTALQLHGSRAQLEGPRGNRARAAQDWRKVVEFAPDDQKPGYSINLALTLASAGEHREAVALARALTTTFEHTDNPIDLYNLACIYGRCLNTPEPASTDSQNPPGDFTAPALDLLRKCHDRGFFKDPANRKLAREDSDLAPFRNHPDFQAWTKPD